MDQREYWRCGIRLQPGEALAIKNVRRAALRRKDDNYARRLRAILLVGEEHLTQAEAARVLESTENWITRMVIAYRRGGVGALVPRKAPGAKPRLTESQLERLKRIIRDGPEEYGLDTGVWTAPIVEQIIEEEFEVRYSTTQVRRILHALGFSLQYPKRILSEAELVAQRKWLKNEFPDIKKKARARIIHPQSHSGSNHVSMNAVVERHEET